MNTTKEIKEYYEKNTVEDIKRVLKAIEENGFNHETYAMLRYLQGNLNELNTASFFYNCWYKKEENKTDKKSA